MERRTFLAASGLAASGLAASGLAATGGVAVASPAAARYVPAGTTRDNEPRGGLAVIASYVTNFSPPPSGLTETLAVGSGLHLERRRHRRYDTNSIAVVTDSGDELGYLPTEQSKILAPLMDGGARFDARISEVRNESRVRVKLALTTATA